MKYVEENSEGELVTVMQEENPEFDIAQYEAKQNFQQLFELALESMKNETYANINGLEKCVMDKDQLKYEFVNEGTPQEADCDKTLVPEASFSLTGFEELNTNNQQLAAENNVDGFNPFNLNFAHIYEKIISYLDVKDILNLSEVKYKKKNKKLEKFPKFIGINFSRSIGDSTILLVLYVKNQ